MASIQRIGAAPGSGLARRTPVASRFGLGPGTGAMLSYLTNAFKPEVNQPGLQPLSPAQITKQATGYVTSAIKPQLSAAESENARATAGGVGQIRGGTRNYMDAMGPYAAQAAQIGKEQSAQDTLESGALSSFLKDSGTTTFGNVALKIAGMDGTDAPVPTNLGAGSAGIAAATGIAAARAAGAKGANNAEYANLLPGFAGLAGQQAENQFRSTQQGNLADQEANLRGQIPGLTSQVVRDLTGNETTKAGARAQAAGDRAGALSTFLGNSVDDQTQLDIANLSGLFGVQKATTAADARTTVAATKAAQPSSSLSRAYGHPVDSTGKTISDTPLPGFVLNPKTGKYEKAKSPTSTAAAVRMAATAKRGAISKADTSIRSIVSGAFKTASKKSSASAGPFGGATSTAKPEVGSPAYNEAVNEAITSAEAILGEFLSHDEIVKFVQQRALHAGWAHPKPQPQPLGPVVRTGPDGIIRPTSPFNPAG